MDRRRRETQATGGNHNHVEKQTRPQEFRYQQSQKYAGDQSYYPADSGDPGSVSVKKVQQRTRRILAETAGGRGFHEPKTPIIGRCPTPISRFGITSACSAISSGMSRWS